MPGAPARLAFVPPRAYHEGERVRRLANTKYRAILRGANMSNLNFDDRDNPYRAPQAEIGYVPVEDASLSEAERIRRAHIGHEASLKSLGVLFFLGGLAALAWTVGLVSVTVANQRTLMGQTYLIVLLVIVVALIPLQFISAVGLMRLAPWSRAPAAIVSAISLLNVPCGTILGAYFLYLLVSRKGALVLSREYREIIRQTPHVKYRTSKSAWIVLAILVAALVGLFIFMSVS